MALEIPSSSASRCWPMRVRANSARISLLKVSEIVTLDGPCTVMGVTLVAHMCDLQSILRRVAHLCDYLVMVATRRGRVQIEPGPWSLAVAEALSALIDARPGRRDRFAKEAGFSARLSQLLNGQRAWYLEDVERACSVLGLDVVAFLASLDVAAYEPYLAAVADDDVSYSQDDPGAAYDGA